MLQATVVSSSDEIYQIYELGKKNLKQNISDYERLTQGFITWTYTPELLQSMQALAPSIVVKEKNRVVGYALTAVQESRAFHKDLDSFLSRLETLHFEGKRLSGYSFYLMGQICIDKDYRGKGLVEMLYGHHRNVFSEAYLLLLTEISVSNPRSQRAHERIGFKTIYTYEDAMDQWNIVLWDWQ